MKSFLCAIHTPGASIDSRPLLLDVYIILYDMLNDDDEELRDIAAIAASHVLANGRGSQGVAFALVPPAASSQLAQLLAEHYRPSPRLVHEAVQRLTGHRTQPSTKARAPPLVSISTILDESMKESTILFVEEKQNLFIDDAKKAETWSMVLALQIAASPKIDSMLAKEFPRWVLEGLASLTKITQLDDAGALLGFTSKPEIFVTGLRVIYAAKALLSHSSPGCGFDFDNALMATGVQGLLAVSAIAWAPEEWLSYLRSVLCDDISAT